MRLGESILDSFKTTTIDLIVKDISKMTSVVKLLIYKPQLVKPQESISYCEVKEGRLGLYHVPVRAKAKLIVSFCQPALYIDVS